MTIWIFKIFIYMKLIITESQFKKVLTENRLDNFVNYFIEAYADKEVSVIIYDLIIKQGFNFRMLNKMDKLLDFISDKIGYRVNLSTPIDELIFYKKLISQYREFGRNNEFKKTIVDLIQGMMDEIIDQALSESGGDIKKATKRLKVINDILGKNDQLRKTFNSEVKEIAKEQGYVIVDKPLTWTFEKGGGRIQQIIDYIKEIPETPKKTRKGWMSYVGENPDRKGWNSYLWRAVLDAGIIEKVRDGRSFTYKLGPNADAFEQGKLIGF